MGRRPNIALAVMVGVASWAWTAPARAAAPACDALGIRVDDDVPAPWKSAIEVACGELVRLPGVDSSARVRLVMKERQLAIEVTLADGRRAERRPSSPHALRATLEALLVVPAERTAPEAAPPASPGGDAPLLPPGAAWPVDDEVPAVRPVAGPPLVGIEVGAGLGGRVAAQGYVSLTPSAFAEIRVGSWLLGMSIRDDVAGWKSAPLVRVFEMQTVAAGLFVGRRFASKAVAFDLGVSPRVASDTQTYETEAGEQSASATDVRVGALGRLAFGGPVLRGLVELDLEVSPARLRTTMKLDPLLPALPSWSAGLTVGLAWSPSP